MIVEYWASATRPRNANGLGLTPAETDEDLREFEIALTRWPDPRSLISEWRTLVLTQQVIGRQVYDARLAAFAQTSQLNRLLTLNAPDFARFHFLRCVSPAQLIAEFGG